MTKPSIPVPVARDNAERESQVKMQLIRLEGEIESAFKSVCALGTRLQSVCVPEHPADPKNEAEPPSSVPLANALQQSVAAIQRLRNTLDDITSRIEL